MLVKKGINRRFKCGLNSKNISDSVLSNNLFNVGKNLKLIIKHKYSFCNVIADEDIQNEIIKDKFLDFVVKVFKGVICFFDEYKEVKKGK